MRRRPSPDSQGTSRAFSLPAPYGGWNARDQLAQMPPTDAVYLDNWFPTLSSVQIRKGSAINATLPLTKTILSLLTCAKSDGTTKRFACANDGVYDVSSSGNVNVAAYAMTSGDVKSQNLNVAGVNYLWNCVGDGVNDSFLYKSDTNSFQAINAASTPALTFAGSEVSNQVSNVHLWQNRLVLCVKGMLAFYYMPLNSVGGAATKFDLGSLLPRGGYLVATSTWSVDAGNGPQQRLVCMSSEGELAIFSGTDPSVANAFSLVGVYYLGKPLSPRPFATIPGDIVVLTASGLWPLSKVMVSATIDRASALSDKIQNAFVSYAQLYGSLPGWHTTVFHQAQMLLVNVPITATVSYQFVMNLTTKAWCRFTNWSASSFIVSNGALYFANANLVYQAWTGLKDRNGPIITKAKQAFTRPFRGQSAHVKLVRPILNADSSFSVTFGIDQDYTSSEDFTSAASYFQQLALWDSAIWDSAIWSSGNTTLKEWRTVNNTPGHSFAFRMALSASAVNVSWPGTDFIIQSGSVFG